MDLKVLSAESNEWEKALEHIPVSNKDLNYTPQWFRSWIEHEKAEPFCLYLEFEGYHILYPFFLSKITNYDLNHDYFDIQSAYGYGGVIANSNHIPPFIEAKFNSLTDEWLHDNNVIAEFIRENPLIKSIKRDASYSIVRQNVYVETNSDYKIPDKQARQNVNKAINNGLTILYDTDLNYLQEFTDLYKKTADRLEMLPYYHFENSYFDNILKLLKEYTTLIHILLNDQIIASGLYFLYNDRATLHLVGSDANCLNLRANDLLYSAAIQFSIKGGAKTLNVGGGTSNDPADTLFRFKSKYSKIWKPVMIGKKILNSEVFNKLTDYWEKGHPQLVDKYEKYFLKYRIDV